MMPTRQLRVRYLVLAAATIAVGLIVHLLDLGLGAGARDVTGDALWAAMMFWWLGVLAPGSRMGIRALIAFAICAAVETSQLYHSPAIDALRETVPGRLVLGSGFDPRDFAAYAAGVLCAVMASLALIRERSSGSPDTGDVRP
jgi:hypothetical protein